MPGVFQWLASGIQHFSRWTTHKLANHMGDAESRVAVLVDCDNTTPEILEYALRVVLRRGYGNHSALANKWQEELVRLAFIPRLHYQYAAGKNRSDLALALDAMKPKHAGPLRFSLLFWVNFAPNRRSAGDGYADCWLAHLWRTSVTSIRNKFT